MRKFLALVLTLIISFPLLLSAMTLISTATFVLDRQFYIDALKTEQVYENLVSDTMVKQIIQNSLSLPAAALTAEIESALEQILTRDYFNTQVEKLVNDLFDNLHGKTDEFIPMLDLKPIKTALNGEQRDEILLALAASLPECSEGQIPGFGNGEQTACKPVGITDQVLVEDYLKPVLPLALSQIPDEAPLVKNWGELENQRNWRSFIPGMAVPASIMLSGLLVIFMALCFWYVSALIADESWRVRLLWMGWTLMMPSIIVFLVGFMAESSIPSYWINTGLDQARFSGMLSTFGLADIIRELIRGALPRVSKSFMITGGFSGSLSLGLIFTGLATAAKKSGERY